MPREKGSPRERKLPKLTQTDLRIARAQFPVPHPRLQFGYRHHVFIAKLKRGEIAALNHLSFQAKAAVTPLFELWPPNPTTATKPAKPLQQHTTGLLQKLANEWTGLPAFLDTKYLKMDAAPSPAHAEMVFGSARSMGLPVVPVTSPFFSQPYQQAIRNIITSDGRGVMFRLSLNFFNDLTKLPEYLSGLMAALGVVKKQVDILIDLEHRPTLAEVEQMGAYCLNSLPFTDDWRTVTLASGCFPSSIAGDPHGSWLSYGRTDWMGWSSVAGTRAGLDVRVPSFGDYGVRCGGEPLFIPNSPEPNLRYSDEKTIWVRKGPKENGIIRAICADLIDQTFFRGPDFSHGDGRMAEKAATTDQKNGTPEQWIQWCTNHHVELTALQIRNLP